ncbi:MAG TPA: class I SAM-dependent methyltransferase [Kofleriaceae bacterium]|nr:class I SAM-dependent methyltransferase [Kofleriaceae bacterium]
MGSEVTRFVGSIPALYDRHLGPVLFEPYAHDLAQRVPKGAQTLLEIAAGTGRVTRQLLAVLPSGAVAVVTDLNEPMLDEAKQHISDPRVRWQAADAMALPFADGAFDVVACQFGLMFVPDKLVALREMRRALRPGGTLLVSVWDAIENNPATAVLHKLAFETFPNDPPMFMKTPFSMPDAAALAALAREAGFSDVRVETVAKTGEAESAAHLATGFVRGNPLWNQLVDRGVDAPAFEAAVAAALTREFGGAPCRSALSAHVLTAVA